ncbi:hypothetical protein [Niabella drilacis]|uniref:Cytochrome c domain-containing protein n=1 Tax=Niabella drilacis (strain DSM 25811 / CCM 8410 / CCUG 62505 / LMG 26954 / E90) TaxID=1285928 RepID=A0A1G6YRZ8_NIADE|nr:hypothetical protein [Niabella drilacis]SDD93052.1 hypothetical protein SAMN04487894_11673 [Niabella drilacis]
MKKMQLFSTGILLAFTALVFANCGGDKENAIDNPPQGDACAGVNAKFTGDVLPLIKAKCQGCHNAGGSAPFALETYEQIKSRAGDIKTQAVTTSNMPKGGPALTAGEKKILGCWIDNGSLNN